MTLGNGLAPGPSRAKAARVGVNLGSVQYAYKKLQAWQKGCPEIIYDVVFGHTINPTVFFVHDFGHFLPVQNSVSKD